MAEASLTRRARLGFRWRRATAANGSEDGNDDISRVIDDFGRFINAYDKVLDQYEDALREIDRLKQENDRLKDKLRRRGEDHA